MDSETSSDIRFRIISEFHSLQNSLQAIFEASQKYTVKPGSDWIGLFLVGWSSIDQFAAKQVVSSDATSAVFPAETLPRDLSNFYQLCYFDKNNDLHGISTTFSFVGGNDDTSIVDASGDGVLIDMNDCDQDEVVLVKTSRSQLENALAKTIQEKLQFQKLLTEQEELNRNLQEKIGALNATNERLSVELEEASSEKAKGDTLFAEHDHLKKRLQDLQNDFDCAKEQLTASSETRLKLTTENEDLSARVRQLTKQMQESQQIVDRLEETLRNAEERLSVNDDLKRMLQQEVDSLMAVQRSLAARLEEAKGECHTLKTKYAKLEKDFEEKKRAGAANEERIADLENAHSVDMLKLLDQKEQTASAERQAAELKMRLEKAADEYRALYRQTHHTQGGANQPQPDSAQPAEQNINSNRTAAVGASLPAEVSCPICDAMIASTEIQGHFEAHDRTEGPQSLEAGRSKCPMCNDYFPVNEIQSHVEGHFEN